MIELVLTVCAVTSMSSCEDRRLSFVAQESLTQCMMQAPPYIAAWTEENPGHRVMRWRCTYPGADDEKT